ncbi:hypothetical protein SAMN06265222_105155 [Neorhodopirellula lusitana]|uniref:Protein kinase domain-containing protein n=1 Tax=Neorhodopirellula lusitana TaxID=445327 RepID=A0ABY1Q429_9BACT|nr:protein kinase [Neorhodopirellula lusitana]SMP56426.1 hypothetical protein SAMN06265222_105155 [Neorhodopirellula lusitana]
MTDDKSSNSKTESDPPEFDPDATVEELGDDPNATVADTGQDDPNATVADAEAFDPDATVAETELDDPNATVLETEDVDLDATVEETTPFDPDATVLEDPNFDPDFDPNATVAEDDSDRTVVEVDLDATVEEDPLAGTVLDETAAFDASDAQSQSRLDETAETIAGLSAHLASSSQTDDDDGFDTGPVDDDATLQWDTADHGSTVDLDAKESPILVGRNLGQTINPRELSPAEADYWQGICDEFAEGGSGVKSAVTSLPPAIDRTIVETRLQIRSQSVATQLQGENEAADYRLVRLLGRGGMGNVFVARQGSLDRLIAVKVIRPLEKDKREKLAAEGKLDKVEQNRRQQFLTEAVVTGDLDHPNIVPIHDVAVSGDSTLFYSMKRVVGTPWSEVIHEKSRDENVEILIKVADAIGFAHTRGVVHRDIKPENVMLGDFGVVMVMDWGIALAKPEFEKLDSITPATGLGGTPSMMSPEMAIGPIEEIGPAADIYLLGATLFMIVTGKPPHHAANVSMCLRAVATNQIRDFDQKHRGELMNIAMKAMATNPADRYPDTKSFQDALREYRSHAESISLASRAEEDHQDAIKNASYSSFSRAQFGFEEAIALWPGNQIASDGLHQNRIDHARAAYANHDYDLGLTLLDENEPDHADLLARLKEALRQRRQRESRFGLLKKTAAALLAFILIGGSGAIYKIDLERTRATENAMLAKREAKIANTERLRADKNAEEAIINGKLAVQKEQEARLNAERANVNAQKAETNAKIASENAELAKRNAEDAKRQSAAAQASAKVARLAQSQAEYESYASKIGLTKARIDRNEFSEARRLIQELSKGKPADEVPWEIRYLSSLANQATASASAPAPLVHLALPQAKPDGRRSGLVAMADGTIASIQVNAETNLLKIGPQVELPGGANATAIAVSENTSGAFVGDELGNIHVVLPTDDLASLDTTSLGSILKGHSDAITAVQPIDDRFLVSASQDRTVRVWDLTTSRPNRSTATLWHIAPVVAVSTVPTADGTLIAAAVSERGVGHVVLWKSSETTPNQFERIGVLDGFDTALTSVRISSNGDQVATGEAGGVVKVWTVSKLKRRETEALVQRAVQAVASGKRPSNNTSAQRSDAVTILGSISDSSTEGKSPDVSPAHTSPVRQLRFSSDGQSLLSSGDDYLANVWTNHAGTLPRTSDWIRTQQLRGHGGPVQDASWLESDTNPDVTKVLTVSTDRSARLWTVNHNDRESLNKKINKQTSANDTSRTSLKKSGLAAPVHDDEIWSASLSADGQQIVTASRDRTAKVLALNPLGSGYELTTQLTPDQEDSQSVTAPSQRQLQEGSPFRAMSMKTDPQRKYLFVGGADSIIRIWDIAQGTEVGTIAGTGLNNILAIAPDTRGGNRQSDSSGPIWILTGSSTEGTSAMIWSWDPTTRRSRLMHRLKGHEETVAAVALSRDGRSAITGDRAGRVILWNVASGQPIGEPIDLLRGTRINDAVFDHKQNSVWLAADDERLSEIDLDARRIVRQFDHQGFVTQVQISEDGTQALTLSELQKVDSTIHRATLWQLSDESPQTLAKLTVESGDRTLGGGRPGINSIQFAPSSREAVLCMTPSGEAGSRAEIWELGNAAKPAERTLAFGLPAKIGDVSSVVIAPQNEIITLHGSSAFCWNTQTGSLAKSYRSHGALTVAAFSPDGKMIATGSRSIKIWDARSGKAITKLETPHEGIVRSIAFLPNPTGDASASNLFVSGGDDGQIRAWRLDQQTLNFSEVPLLNDQPSTGRPLSLSVSNDGKNLLATTDLGEVIVYDLQSGSSRMLLSDPAIGAVRTGCFSPDGQYAAAAGDDRLARAWNLDNDDPPVIAQGHAEAIEDIAIFGTTRQNNQRLFTASQDRSVRVWDPRDPTNPTRGRELLELVGHQDGVTSVSLNPSGDVMVTAGRDGRVLLWSAASGRSVAGR